MRDNHRQEVADAARRQASHQELLERLVDGETEQRSARAAARRIATAKLHFVRQPDSFDWTWPSKINRDLVQHLLTLAFIRAAENVVFIGNTGLGKTHLACAIGREACLRGFDTLFCTAAKIVNDLTEARGRNMLGRAIRRYARPRALIVDEMGYMPIDHAGAEMLFQVVGERYEKASTIFTTNRPYRQWVDTFAGDATLTSVVIDRVTHHSHTVVIEGDSYRTKNIIER
jgi:DNA replication protein DnaC